MSGSLTTAAGGTGLTMERRQLHGTRDGLWILCRDGVAKVRFDGVDGCGWKHLLLRGLGVGGRTTNYLLAMVRR